MGGAVERIPLPPGSCAAIDASMLSIPSQILAAYRQRATVDTDVLRKKDPIHINNSYRTIIAAATIALENARINDGSPTSALLLGGGNCFDIPLEWLATRFDKVTLVDINPDRAEDSLNRIPSHLRPKVDIVIADVTGIQGELANKIQAAATTSTNADDFLTKLTVSLDTMTVRDKAPQLGTDYTFVSSHLLMSQFYRCLIMELAIHLILLLQIFLKLHNFD